MKNRLLLMLLWPGLLLAQVKTIQYHASNRMEYRYGADDKSEEFNNWLDVDYTLDNFTTGLRVEWLHSSRLAFNQESISQRYFQYEKDGVKVRLGNFYKRLGKGLIFHAFEMRNIALDRVQQSFVVDRNVDGMLIELMQNRYDVSLLSGRPVWMNGENVRGGEAKVRPFTFAEMGFSYLRVNGSSMNDESRTELRSGQLGLTFSRIDINAEYATRSAPTKLPHAEPGKAMYIATNFFGDTYGLSLEYKDYDEFFVKYNNPPTLVREHFVTLLNRHTHVANTRDEVGYQGELYFSPTPVSSMVLHISKGSNHDNDEFSRYQEMYAEWRQLLGQQLDVRLMADHGYDKAVGDKRRITAATELDYYLDAMHSVLLDVQTQKIEKSFADLTVNNYLILIAFSRSSIGTISLQYEKTDDKFLENKSWSSVNLSLQINQQHELFITYGKRRAGLVCSGGYCQIVPEFEGWEIRLNSRF